MFVMLSLSVFRAAMLAQPTVAEVEEVVCLMHLRTSPEYGAGSTGTATV